MLKSIQFLRGVAVILVLLFHLFSQACLPDKNCPSGDSFFFEGYAGVDIFFVISGFIMVYISWTAKPGLIEAAKFFRKRVYRIYPIWWIFASLMILASYIIYGQFAPPDYATGTDIFPYLVKSYLLYPQSEFPVLAIGWTLIHEMLFYTLFSICFIFGRRVLFIFLLIWSLLILGTLALAEPIAHAGNIFELFLSPLNIEFILGCLIGYLYCKNIMRYASVCLIMGTGLFIIAFYIGGYTTGPGFYFTRVVVYGLPSAMIIYGLVNLEKKAGLNIPSPLIHLGNISYSLYLSHMLVILSLREIWKMANGVLPNFLQFGQTGPIDELLFILFGLLGSLIFAHLFYIRVEKPLMQAFKTKRIAKTVA